MLCTDTEYKFYALNSKNKLILGFDDETEVNKYCKKYGFKKFTRNGLKNKKINPNKIDFWVYENETPKFD